MTPEEIWRQKTDEDLLAASTRLDEYTDVGQRAIVAELQRRRESGLLIEPVPAHDSSSIDLTATPEPRLGSRHGIVGHLWRGDVSLPRTYWAYGVVGNLIWRILIVLAIGAINRSLLLLLLLLYLSYCVFISVAIWRSAGRYKGDRTWGHLARLSLVLALLGGIVRLLGT
jgi:hypothetical protein